MQGLGLLLHNAASHLKREFERAARPYGLTLLQWRVLGTLSRNRDGLTQTALACQLEASPMTISDVLERLETGGLVIREVDPSDSRAKRVRITPDGSSQLAEMRTVAAAVYERAAEGIDAADREAMVRALNCMVANLEALGTNARDKT